MRLRQWGDEQAQAQGLQGGCRRGGGAGPAEVLPQALQGYCGCVCGGPGCSCSGAQARTLPASPVADRRQPAPRSYNIWHTWNEGLMGAFQTLREQGMLPLAQVDAAGNMR